MRRGCISLGDIHCDNCHRTIRYLEHYLVMEETEDVIVRVCFDCAATMGYAKYRQEKAEGIITFFPE